MTIINEAVLQYSIVLKDQALTALSNLQTAVDRINESASKLGTYLTGKGDLKSFFMDVLSGSNDLLNLSKTTGFSTEALQKWSYAAKSAGVSSEAILSNMKSLKGQWGIGEKDLVRYAKSFQKMGAWGRYQMGSLLGMSEDMITLLSQGPDAVQKWLDEAEKMGAVLPKDEIEKAAEAHKKWNTTLESFHKTSEKTLTPFIEKFTIILNKINEFQKNNPDKTFNLIETALKQILALGITSWAIKTVSSLKQIWKVLTPFPETLNSSARAAESMGREISGAVDATSDFGNQTQNVEKLNRSFSGLKNTINGIVSIFKGFVMGEVIAEWIDALTNGKYSDKLGEFWGDVFFKAGKVYDKITGKTNTVNPMATPEELSKKYLPDVYSKKIGETALATADNFGKTLVMPSFDTGNKANNDFGGDIIAALNKMTMSNTSEGTPTAMAAGGNTFIFYNIGSEEMQQIMNMNYGG